MSTSSVYHLYIDCTGAPDCAALDREPCSLSTPEHSCGVCHTQRDGGGMEEWGNSSCVASVEVYSTTTLHSTAFYSTATLHSTASVTVEQGIYMYVYQHSWCK